MKLDLLQFFKLATGATIEDMLLYDAHGTYSSIQNLLLRTKIYRKTNDKPKMLQQCHTGRAYISSCHSYEHVFGSSSPKLHGVRRIRVWTLEGAVHLHADEVFIDIPDELIIEADFKKFLAWLSEPLSEYLLTCPIPEDTIINQLMLDVNNKPIPLQALPNALQWLTEAERQERFCANLVVLRTDLWLCKMAQKSSEPDRFKRFDVVRANPKPTLDVSGFAMDGRNGHVFACGERSGLWPDSALNSPKPEPEERSEASEDSF